MEVAGRRELLIPGPWGFRGQASCGWGLFSPSAADPAGAHLKVPPAGELVKRETSRGCSRKRGLEHGARATLGGAEPLLFGQDSCGEPGVGLRTSGASGSWGEAASQGLM